MLGRRLQAPLRLWRFSLPFKEFTERAGGGPQRGHIPLVFARFFFFFANVLKEKLVWIFFFIAAQFCQDILFALIRLFQFCFFSFLGRERVKSGLWDLENPPGLKRVCRSS